MSYDSYVYIVSTEFPELKWQRVVAEYGLLEYQRDGKTCWTSQYPEESIQAGFHRLTSSHIYSDLYA